MLPSLVVEEVRRGVAETLRAQFEPSTALFRDAIGRLIDAPPWVRGPYVQLGLPFVEGERGRDWFPDFQTGFPAHRHQERAWDLCGRQGRSTLVAIVRARHRHAGAVAAVSTRCRGAARA